MREREEGFTLVEIMLVVIIIGVLAAMVVPRFAGRTQQAKIARAKADIASIGVALDLYELDLGKYPGSSEEFKNLVSTSAPAGVDEETKKRWNGPYLKKGLPIDPWGREYLYEPKDSGRDYALKSLGPDGQPGTDDLTSAEQ